MQKHYPCALRRIRSVRQNDYIEQLTAKLNDNQIRSVPLATTAVFSGLTAFNLRTVGINGVLIQ